MNSKKIILCIVALTIMKMFTVRGISEEKIYNNPNIALQNGQGIDIKNQSLIKPIVAVFELPDKILDNAGIAEINISYVDSVYELSKHFSLNLNACVKSITYGGSVGVGFVDNLNISDSAVSFVYECKRSGVPILSRELKMSQQLKDTIETLKAQYKGKDLHREVTKVFGTHFITGYENGVNVGIVYSLNSSSSVYNQGLALDLKAKYNGGATSVQFQTEMKKELSKNTHGTSLEYRFVLRGFNLLPDFPLNGNIKNINEFNNHIAKVQEFCAKLDLKQARPLAYLIQPLQNLPGYIQALDGFIPDQEIHSSYENFIDLYSELTRWNDLLSKWLTSPSKIYWMNKNGMEFIRSLHGETTDQIEKLRKSAKNYFEKGEELKIDNQSLEIIEKLSQIPIPRIVVFKRFSGEGNKRFGIGYVNFGSKKFVKENPIFNIFVENSNPNLHLGGPIKLQYLYHKWIADLKESQYEGIRDAAFAISDYLPEFTKVSEVKRIAMFLWENSGKDDTNTENSWILKLINPQDEVIDKMFYVENRTSDIQ